MFRRITILAFTSCILLLPEARAQLWAKVDSGCYMGSFYTVYGDSSRNLLYVGGNFDSCGNNFYPVAGFASWDGTSWTNLTGGETTFGGDWTYCIAKYKGHIYHGMRNEAGAFGNVFKEEQSESNRIVQMNGSIYCMAVFNNELYIGGAFSKIVLGGDTSVEYSNIARWDGNIWKQVGAGIKSGMDTSSVYAMFVWNNMLYVGGRFDSAGNISANNLAEWNGSTWKNCGTGITYSTGEPASVTALGEYQNSLIVGGNFNKAGNIKNVKDLVAYDGHHTWNNMGINFDDEVDAICNYDGELYMAGLFKFGTNDARIVRFNGANWLSLGDGSWQGGRVSALTVWQESLYAAGRFSKVDGLPVNNIARWTMIPVLRPMNFYSLKHWTNESYDEIFFEDDNIETKKFIVFNELGQPLLAGEISRIETGSVFSLDIKDLHPGFYVVKIFDEDAPKSFCFTR